MPLKRWIVAEHRASEDVPPRTVGAEPSRLAILVGTLDDGRKNNRARDNPRLRCLMCGAATKEAVIHQEGDGKAHKAQQCLDRKERHLPAVLNRTAGR